MGLSGGMEVDDEEKKKKINEDVMVFLRKQSETQSPRYATRLKNLVNLQQKRRRAAAARRHSDQQIVKTDKAGRPKNVDSKTLNTAAHRASKEEVGKRHGRGEKSDRKSVRSRSGEPSDRCGRRRRRRRSRCRKKRRRRRSRSRRRRRRSCRRRRKKGCRRRRRRRC